MEDIQIFMPSELREDSYKELLPSFFQELNNDYQQLREACKARNHDEIWRVAHKMKGQAASYSALLLFAKAKDLQEVAYFEDEAILEAKLADLGKGLSRSQTYARDFFQLDH